MHALTDVTGFGLAGHAARDLRAAPSASAAIDWPRGAAATRACASSRAQGFVTGASGRNWAGYGADVDAARRLRGRGPARC
ncbi:MAG: hypothetical protein MZW92_28970 [Comamonadaceae bacterium]|nr:hypothetical protein [Comamonadaceae bacterium]